MAMEPFGDSIDTLFIDKVRRAQRMPQEKKFLLGPRLYESARRIAMTAIRTEHPAATPEEQRRLFRDRLQVARLLEENPL